MEIKSEFKKDKNNIYSLSVDCGDFHYSKHSKDKNQLKDLFNIVNIIKLGLNEEFRKYEK